MKRKTKKARLKLQLENIVKAYVKERDNHICQWCGKRVTGSDEHWSHIVPRSKDGRLVYDPMNSVVHCFNCHINRWHKDPLEGAKWFMEKFPGRWVYLQEQRKMNESKGPITEAWLQDQIELMENNG